MFVSGKLFQPSLMVAIVKETTLRGEYLKVLKAQALLAKIRPNWKGLPGRNTLLTY
jgi:hypothetical protein